MAHPSDRRRRRALSENSDSSTQSKRRRLDSISDVDGDGDADDALHAYQNTNGAHAASTQDEFQPGAIVCVKVENFVTYEKAEFFPGPHLNMVIGPNGTGKSSLVCAICLGLGYSPRHLGRAGSVKEFVKHGKDTAVIEIELCKRPQDRKNHVVRVQIRREQNSQKWWINGKEATHKAVQALMQSLKIQVDNLCQFLPQDRVVEFAASTPVDLLRETLRAAAPAEMLQWQRELQDLHKDKKEIAAAAQANKDSLANLETRQQGLQADVDRIREREEIQARIKDLKSAVVIAAYAEARNSWTEARQRKKEAQNSLQKLQEESGPSLEAINDKKEYKRNIDAAMPALQKALSDADKEAKKAAAEMHKAADELNKARNQLETEKKGYTNKKKELAASVAKITQIKADLKQQPPKFNAAEWNQKIRSKQHNKRELETESQQIVTDFRELRKRNVEAKQEMQRIKAELESLNTQQGQQLAFMKKHSDFQDAVKGWEWVQENQGEFEKEVFGPPMISCSIKDMRYSDQVQALLQKSDMACFTAQTKNDFKKLSNKLYRDLNLSVVIRTCQTPLEAFKPPVDAAEARKLGLDGFALNYVDGPASVLAMLCAERRLHQAGLSLQEHSDAQYERLVQDGKVSQWAAGRHVYVVRRRREYGPKAMTTMSNLIARGRFWTSQPVSAQEKDRLELGLTETKGVIEALTVDETKLMGKRRALEEEISEIDNAIRRMQSDKDALQVEYQKWSSLPEKMETEENRKKAHEGALEEIDGGIEELHQELMRAGIKRAQLALRHARVLGRLKKADAGLVEAEVMGLEALSEIEALKKRNAGIMERLQQEKEKLDGACKEVEETKAKGQQLRDQVQATMSGVDEERRALLTRLAEGRPCVEIEWDVSAEEAKLELIHTANPNAVREYERRALEIGRLQAKTEDIGRESEELDGKLGELMGQWEPRLDELVSTISDAFAYNFEQINCAGEIRVHKDDDFDQWALDIMVKFRENESLQQLTAHRQSGGERAVSTIFFLMALQSMAQAPFRVVDEINQGMDPRNERMVHERMVDIACRQHTSQYFLITPKLLSGLRYHEKMRVLCIVSGEHMPRHGAKLDFARCLAREKHLRGAAAVS
ncbi:hypothetical protein CDD82_5719 [Ophiocordyceps australis]|uniref:Structural maintenance of chromosomes protein 5 n=1 Tax=Ophiocordyceps australis TaxID=1399860 RepID=A0A2C5XHW0_9HYPO|nr:hypothetical protein CDD82_5719 [Ophiocordyceps australis]